MTPPSLSKAFDFKKTLENLLAPATASLFSVSLACLLTFPLHFKLAAGYRTGFLKRDIGRCHDAYAAWLKERGVGPSLIHVYSQLEAAMLALEPPQQIPAKSLLLETVGAWTAIIDDRLPYPDPVATVATLCQKLGCDGIVACAVPDACDEFGKRLYYGATQFEMFSPHKTDFLNYKRTISVAHAEEGWRFDQAGEIYKDLRISRVIKVVRIRRPVRCPDANNRLFTGVGYRGTYEPRWFTGNAVMIGWEKKLKYANTIAETGVGDVGDG